MSIWKSKAQSRAAADSPWAVHTAGGLGPTGLCQHHVSSVPQIASCHASTAASTHIANDGVSMSQDLPAQMVSGNSQNSLASQSGND